MAEFVLEMPFLNHDPNFAFGVEFGMFFAKLLAAEEAGVREIEDYFMTENQDQILLAASRRGWRVARMEPWREQWFSLRLEK